MAKAMLIVGGRVQHIHAAPPPQVFVTVQEG